ncbi:hypothetical protein AO392_01655 [Pseudomonas putida]|nr:hypothetical protein AO392_01655 [Pseudomonas putida]
MPSALLPVTVVPLMFNVLLADTWAPSLAPVIVLLLTVAVDGAAPTRAMAIPTAPVEETTAPFTVALLPNRCKPLELPPEIVPPLSCTVDAVTRMANVEASWVVSTAPLTRS